MLNTKGATAKNGVLSSLGLWSGQSLELKADFLAQAIKLSSLWNYHGTFLDFCLIAL